MLRKFHRRLAWMIIRMWQWSRIAGYRLISDNWPPVSPVLRQPVHCTGRGKIEIGRDVQIGVFPSPKFTSTYAYLEARNESSCISIGSGTRASNNLTLIAEHGCIRIGKDCLIGADVEIIDSDFHGLHPGQRLLSLPEWSRDVHVGDNVFIAAHSKILKGSRIGTNSIIAAGSVVTGEVPANSIAGGNPARVIRTL
jgi:maltose O-acetyltransferase